MTNPYRQTLEYLFARLPMFQRIGAPAFRKDLTNTIALCDLLGHPENHLRCIHIAGTNGKGSVAHMLAAVLAAAGLKTGLYTSPHYRDFRERIRIDGQPISRREVVDFVAQHHAAFERIQPSFFEWTVALAFHHFHRHSVEVAVIETGLGGRFDSTNVITPLLSIITNIGLDHQPFLGNTPEAIAFEKAGIIKPRVPVIIGQTQPETQPLFRRIAAERRSPITFADEQFQAVSLRKSGTHTYYRIESEGQTLIEELPLNHLAYYQALNLPAVLAAFYSLRNDWPITLNHLTDGLSRLKALTGFMGRWEFIRQRPRILVDSAHNADGLRQFVSGLQNLSFRKLWIVMGVVQDKSLEDVLPLLPKDAVYFFAKADIPRGLHAAALQQQAAHYGLHGRTYASVRNALAAAVRKAHPEHDLVVVTGSIFTVAEVLPHRSSPAKQPD